MPRLGRLFSPRSAGKLSTAQATSGKLLSIELRHYIHHEQMLAIGLNCKLQQSPRLQEVMVSQQPRALTSLYKAKCRTRFLPG